jgi:Tfp pilus assembly protein PilF
VPARDTLARADAAGLSGDDLEHLRAQVLVGTQAGQSGIRAVQAALRSRRRDGDLHLALARLEMQAERWGDASLELATLTPTTEPRLTAQLLRILALGHMGREAPVEQATEQVRAAVTPEAPLTNAQEATLAVAQAWVELHDEARERAGVLARRALELDPGNAEAELVLAGIETQLGHDPEPHLRAALAGHPTPALALGALALGGTLDAERCDFGRRYVAAAPSGQYARDVRARIATCH